MTTINQVDYKTVQSIRQAVRDCTDRGLTVAAKWCVQQPGARVGGTDIVIGHQNCSFQFLLPNEGLLRRIYLLLM
jgi:hypothetical protein